MTVNELIEKLQKLPGELPVMITDPNSRSSYEAFIVAQRVAEEGDYPEEWDMPAGFKFVEITQ